MFERLTERCKRALDLARQEAMRLGSDSVNTQHLLLGLLQAGEGVAYRVLQALQADLEQLRLRICDLHPPPVLPTFTFGSLPFSPPSIRVLERAGEACRLQGHRALGTEHLLLGLVQDHEGMAARLLVSVGLELDEVRDKLLERLGREPLEIDIAPAWKYPPALADPILESLHQDQAQAMEQRPRLQDDLLRMIQVNRILALVGPPGAGKTTLMSGIARSKAGGYSMRTVDYRIFDPFHQASFEWRSAPGTLCYVPEGEMLTASRRLPPAFLFQLKEGADRVVLEFRPGGLEAFQGSFPELARDLVRFEVPQPGPEESQAYLASARARIRSTMGFAIPDDLIDQTASMIRGRLPGAVMPWTLLGVLWKAAGIEKSTWAAGDVELLERDVARAEAEGPSEAAEAMRRHLEGIKASARRRVDSTLTMESIRLAIADLARGTWGP